MRKIKFRAWDKTLNIMCDVAAINFYYCNVVLLARDKEQKKLFQKINKKILIECDNRISVPMNEVELMQYTVLDDKNCEGIFEGDVLGNEKLSTKWTAGFNRGAFVLKSKGVDMGVLHNCSSIDGQIVGLKVIGNIHENKDLLEG